MAEILGPQRLGPLTPLVGEWEGNVGVDLSYHNNDDETGKTSYFEKAWFHPIPTQQNGQQFLEGLAYKMTAWRHGEEAMDPFHDEAGYLLWDKKRGFVMRAVTFGRGISILAGSKAGARDKVVHFNAKPGALDWGIVQNPYLVERAKIEEFKSSFHFDGPDTFSYKSDLLLKLAATGAEMHHTDENTLQRVKKLP